MKPWILLRAAAIMALLLGIGHTLGAPWTPAHGVGEQVVLDAMQSQQFDAMGDTRTYWSFYIGFGWSITVYLLAQAIVLWQLAARSKVDPLGVRPVVAVFLVSTLLTGAIAWRYILEAPVVFCVVLALLLALGVWACGRFSHGAA